MRASITSAYEYASTLDSASWRKCLQRLLREVKKSGGYLNADDIAASMNIPVREARDLFLGFSATVALLIDNPVSSDQFIAAAEKSLLQPELVPAARAATEYIVESRTELERALARRRLAASVLPALESFDVAVDVRFRFKDNKIEEAVPVAIVRIDTDAFAEQLWIQLADGDVEELLRKLNEVRAQLEILGKIPF